MRGAGLLARHPIADAAIGARGAAEPGDEAVWPLTGRLIHVSAAYAGSILRSLIIVGSGEHEGWMARLDYVLPAFTVGETGKAGELLGTVQDVAAYWATEQPEHPGVMKGHVHIELWRVTDPQQWVGIVPAPVQT